MTRQGILDRLKAEAPALRLRFGLTTLAVFGSVARGDDHERSDLDVLVTFEGKATFDRFMGLKLYLEDTFGRSVDLVTPNSLRPDMRAEIEKEAVLVRKVEHRIDDIILCCDKILRFTRGMSQQQLDEQELVQDAVLRNIEVIGEAAKNLSDEVRARMPGIDWKKIAGMRDWLSHVYYRVDPEIVWDVVQNGIPDLLRTVKAFKDEG